MLDVRRTVDAVWKQESARIVAGLTRLVRDVGLAEELAQDALVSALEQWPQSGVPQNPGAWLTAVAKRRAVDEIRRARTRERTADLLVHEAREEARQHTAGDGAFDAHDTYDTYDAYDEPNRAPADPEGAAQDDVLRLMFVSCHPVLPTGARVALTLRLLGGLTAAEIARAFLTTETTIARRIADAKRTLASERVPFELPDASALADRLSAVLEVVYLIFNEGYAATAGDDLMRPGLTLEALRLGRLLARLAPAEPEVHGLVALMEVQESRSTARTGPAGEPVPLHEQNRGRWDRLLIRRGIAAMLLARDAARAGGGAPPGPYVLQAAIAITHAQAPTAADTDWAGISGLYEALERLLPTPVVRLNRAVAVGHAIGPEAGLALVADLEADPALRDYHLLPGVRGDLLVRLGRYDRARLDFERAAGLTANAAERAFLRRRADAAALAAAHTGRPEPRTAGPVLGAAAAEFLARDGLDAASVRSYGQTLGRLRRSLGDAFPLAALTPEGVDRVFTTAWSQAAPATWNRHRSAYRSFATWAGLDAAVAAGPERRAGSPTPTRPLAPAELDALFARDDVPLRERTLWRLLYESGAPVTAVLALNVPDLDAAALADRRARAGERWIGWRAGAARLLPELLAGRSGGPLFLTDRRPGPARRRASAADVCPDSGRARLSYERAEHLFKQSTKPLDADGTGWTLRQLKGE
ncbi:sigma-70 family RNA polymerase sigma factor [Streptomyces sp. NPDC020412]|uniref:sigma-70 family RNA polymerase sigma factor n=1 Tax=Streptomyces sp. NPDC020412 TaxID=3365073 RepID=UPI00379DE2E4